MPIVTITSDLGHSDYYAAALKGALLRDCSAIQLVELAQHLNAFDVKQAAYVVRHAFPYFAAGSIHLIYLNPAEANGTMICAQHENQFFISFNNGITT